MNYFDNDLKYSDDASMETFWDVTYRKAFPNLVNHMRCSGNTESQRMGIDRVLSLANRQTLKVEEKKRREVWPDFLLEYLSNDKTKAPGWIEKDLDIVYFAYAFMPTEEVHLLPWHLLRRAWIENKDEWLRKYPHKCAPNPGYNTWSVAVPINVVYAAIMDCMCIKLREEDEEEF